MSDERLDAPTDRAVDLLAGSGGWHFSPFLGCFGLFWTILVIASAFRPVPDEPGTGRAVQAMALLVPFGIFALAPLVRVGERGVVRSTLLLRLIALFAPGLAAGFEVRCPFEGLKSLTFPAEKTSEFEDPPPVARFAYTSGRVVELGLGAFDHERRALDRSFEAYRAASAGAQVARCPRCAGEVSARGCPTPGCSGA